MTFYVKHQLRLFRRKTTANQRVERTSLFSCSSKLLEVEGVESSGDEDGMSDDDFLHVRELSFSSAEDSGLIEFFSFGDIFPHFFEVCLIIFFDCFEKEIIKLFIFDEFDDGEIKICGDCLILIEFGVANFSGNISN